MTRVIGLCGPEGAGKSAVAQIVATNYGGLILPFAEPLKRMVLALGVDERHVFGSPEDKLEPLPLFGGKTARQILQALGTEWGRKCVDEDFWIRAWRSRFDTTDAPLVVSDDLRFANEAAAIRELGGVIVCVVRALKDFERKPKHASEDFAAVPHDWVLVNDGSLEILHKKITVLFGSNGELPRFLAPNTDTAQLLPPSPIVRAKNKLAALNEALNDSLQRNSQRLGFLS